MKVAIDGPAGSGKSTVAHALAAQLGLTFLDTGAMYRAVTLVALEQGLDLEDDEALSRLADTLEIAFDRAPDGGQLVLVDGRDVTSQIRTEAIDRNVSRVAAVAGVRDAMVARQRVLAEGADVVAEGRDIGTVVFPDAEVKVFLTADPTSRAHRRALQRDISDPAAEQQILEDLKRRDEADSTRAVAPLRPADDAVHVDSTAMTVEEEVALIASLMEQARQQGQAPQSADSAEEAPDAASGKADEAQDERDRTSPRKEGNTPKDTGGAQEGGRLRAFSHNEVGDYHDAAMSDFPLPARAFYAAAVLVCGALSKLFWPWTVEDGANLWDAPKGVVVVMNHVSMLDPIIAVVTEWSHGRRMRPIYKSDFDRNKPFSWLLSRLGCIPVTRGKADLKAVRRAQRALKRGEDVLVYPEGTRIRSDDQEVELHAGFALMAQLAKAPVVPLAICGARDGTPGGNGMLRPHRIHLAAGKPITFDELEVKGRKKQAKAMEERAMGKVYELRDSLFARFGRWR